MKTYNIENFEIIELYDEDKVDGIFPDFIGDCDYHGFESISGYKYFKTLRGAKKAISFHIKEEGKFYKSKTTFIIYVSNNDDEGYPVSANIVYNH